MLKHCPQINDLNWESRTDLLEQYDFSTSVSSTKSVGIIKISTVGVIIGKQTTRITEPAF